MTRDIVNLFPPIHATSPACVSAFLYFTDLSPYLPDGKPPYVFSVVRHPVQRFVSFYNYVRFGAPEWGKYIFQTKFKVLFNFKPF